MKSKVLSALIFTVLILCAGIMLFGGSNGKKAVIYCNGNIVAELDIQNVSKPYEYPVIKNGHTNILLIEKGCVSVKTTDCPDKLCVKQGRVSNSSSPIVCLPNNIVVKIISSSQTDAVSR